jgi:hypothetical protein
MAHIIDEIYGQIDQLFGAQTQLFTMEFPGRVLDQANYAYNSDTINAFLTKPQTVAESEFRLSDDLFDVAQVVNGPNGKKLSDSYDLALNMFLPVFQANETLAKDKSKIRSWLLEQIEDTVDGVTFKGSRMEYFRILNSKYLTAKSAWEEKKTSGLKDAMTQGTDEALDDYARWLASEAPVQEAELEAFYEDLVVRGYYHEIKTELGLLDLKSMAEELEEAKARLRASAKSSLDESMTVYPVQYQPADWFKGMISDFRPIDLLLDPEVIQNQLITEQKQLDDLETQLAVLQADPTGDIKDLQQQVQQAQEALDTANSNLLKNYTNAVIGVAKIYFAQKNKEKQDASKGDFDQALKDKLGSGPLTDDQWNQLQGFQNAAIDAQSKLQSATRALSDLQAQLAAANSTDTKAAQLQIQSQIKAIKDNINQLNAMVQLQYSSEGPGDNKPASVAMLPSSPPEHGNFFDIVITHKGTTVKDDSKLVQGSSQTSWSVDVLFGSASGYSDSSWSTFTQKNTAQSIDIQIGFRAMKVTLDRGGWLNPQFFDAVNSGSMYSMTPSLKLAAGQLLAADLTNPSRLSDVNKMLLPAIPVAFLLVKDVTLKYSFTGSDADTANSYLKTDSGASGGFLCFSVSHSETQTTDTKSFHSTSIGNDVFIRIPQPQILGWFVEYMPKDNSLDVAKYQPISDYWLPEDPQKFMSFRFSFHPSLTLACLLLVASATTLLANTKVSIPIAPRPAQAAAVAGWSANLTGLVAPPGGVLGGKVLAAGVTSASWIGINFAKHHIVPQTYLQVVAGLAINTSAGTDALRSRLTTAIKAIAAGAAGGPPNAWNLGPVVWAPVNLFEGPTGFLRSDDPGDGPEPNKPKSFDASRWKLLLTATAAVDGVKEKLSDTSFDTSTDSLNKQQSGGKTGFQKIVEAFEALATYVKTNNPTVSPFAAADWVNNAGTAINLADLIGYSNSQVVAVLVNAKKGAYQLK